jgi:hypothetical protein
MIGKSASEKLHMLILAYGEYAMRELSVFEWHRWFKERREVVQEDGIQKYIGQMQVCREYKPCYAQIED